MDDKAKVVQDRPHKTTVATSQVETLEQTGQLAPLDKKDEKLKIVQDVSQKSTVETSQVETFEQTGHLAPLDAKDEKVKITQDRPQKTTVETSQVETLEQTGQLAPLDVKDEKVKVTQDRPEKGTAATSQVETLEQTGQLAPLDMKDEKVKVTQDRPQKTTVATSQVETVEQTGQLAPLDVKDEKVKVTQDRPEKSTVATSQVETLEQTGQLAPLDMKDEKVKVTQDRPQKTTVETSQVETLEQTGQLAPLDKKDEKVKVTQDRPEKSTVATSQVETLEQTGQLAPLDMKDEKVKVTQDRPQKTTVATSQVETLEQTGQLAPLDVKDEKVKVTQDRPEKSTVATSQVETLEQTGQLAPLDMKDEKVKVTQDRPQKTTVATSQVETLEQTGHLAPLDVKDEKAKEFKDNVEVQSFQITEVDTVEQTEKLPHLEKKDEKAKMVQEKRKGKGVQITQVESVEHADESIPLEMADEKVKVIQDNPVVTTVQVSQVETVEHTGKVRPLEMKDDKAKVIQDKPEGKSVQITEVESVEHADQLAPLQMADEKGKMTQERPEVTTVQVSQVESVEHTGQVRPLEKKDKKAKMVREAPENKSVEISQVDTLEQTGKLKVKDTADEKAKIVEEVPQVAQISQVKTEKVKEKKAIVIEEKEEEAASVTVEKAKKKDEAVIIKKLKAQVPEEETEETLTVKKAKPKEVPTEDVEELVTIPKVKAKEVPTEEVEEVVTIEKVKTKKGPTEEAQEVVTIRKKSKEVSVEDVAAITVEKIKPKEISVEETEEIVTIQKEKPQEVPTEQVEEAVTIQKGKPKVAPTEEVEEMVTLPKEKAKVTTTEEVEEKVTIQKVKVKEGPTEEVEEVVTLPKKKVRKSSVEKIEKKVTIEKVDIQEVPTEEIEEVVTIEKKVEPKVTFAEEVEEMVTLPKGKPQEVTITEEPEEKVTIQQVKVKEGPTEEVEEVVTLPKKKVRKSLVEKVEKKVTVEKVEIKEEPTEEEVVTIIEEVKEKKVKQQKEKSKDVPTEEVEEMVTLPKGKPQEVTITEEPEEKVTIQKVKVKEGPTEEVEEVVTLPKKKVRKSSVEKVEKTVTVEKVEIKEEPTEEEVVTIIKEVKEKKVKQPKEKSKDVPTEEVEEMVTLPKVKPQEVTITEEPEEKVTIQKVKVKEGPTETTEEVVTLPKTKKKVKEAATEEVEETVTIEKVKVKESPVEEVEQVFTVPKKRAKEVPTDEVEESFTIGKVEIEEMPAEVEEMITLPKRKSIPVEEVDVEEMVTIPKVRAKEVPTEEVEEKVTIRKQKSKELPTEELAELTLKREIPLEVEDIPEVVLQKAKKVPVEKVEEKVTIQKVKAKEMPGEELAELTIKMEIPSKVEDIEEVVLQKAKAKEVAVEEVQESVTIIQVKPKEGPSGDVTETATIKRIRRKGSEPEDVEESVTIRKKNEGDVSESLTIRRAKPKEVGGEDVEESLTIRRKKEKKVVVSSEDAAESLTVRREVEVTEEEEEKEEAEEEEEDRRLVLRKSSRAVEIEEMEEEEEEEDLAKGGDKQQNLGGVQKVKRVIGKYDFAEEEETFDAARDIKATKQTEYIQTDDGTLHIATTTTFKGVGKGIQITEIPSDQPQDAEEVPLVQIEEVQEIELKKEKEEDFRLSPDQAQVFSPEPAKTYKASKSQKSLSEVTVTEVTSSESAGSYDVASSRGQTAVERRDEKEGVTVDVVHPIENEEYFEGKPQIRGTRAGVNVVESQTINVTQVLTSESGQLTKDFSAPKKSNVNVTILSNESVGVSQVTTEVGLGDVSSEKPRKEEAKVGDNILDRSVAVVTEVKTTENVSEKKKEKVSKSRKASVTQLKQLSVETTEVIVKEECQERTPDAVPRKMSATGNVLPINIVSIEELQAVSPTGEVPAYSFKEASVVPLKATEMKVDESRPIESVDTMNIVKTSATATVSTEKETMSRVDVVRKQSLAKAEESEEKVLESYARELEDQKVRESRAQEKAEPLQATAQVTQDVVLQKPKVEQVVEETAADFTVKKVQEVEQVEEAVTIKKTKKKEAPKEEVEESVTIKKTKPKKAPTEEVEESMTIKKTKPKEAPTEDVEESMTIKRVKPKETPTEDVEESMTIKKQQPKEAPQVEEDAAAALTVVREEVQESVTIKKTKKKELPSTEETEESVTLKREATTMGETEITESMTIKKKTPFRKQNLEAETVTLRQVEQVFEDIEGDYRIKLKKSAPKQPYSVEEEEAEASIVLENFSTMDITEISEEAEESLRMKIVNKPKSPAPESVVDFVEEDVGVIQEFYYAVASYVAEEEGAMNLVEGERVYVIESHTSDWWFVRKNITEEKGWVPKNYLLSEASYTHFVQKKLAEKIDKLPTFDDGKETSAPEFAGRLQSVTVADGAEVTFQVRIRGSNINVTWFRQTQIIKNSKDFQIFYDVEEDITIATLIIKEVFPEDSGLYTVVAKNRLGTETCSAELTVTQPLSDHGSDSTLISRMSVSRESSLADILEGIPPTFSNTNSQVTVFEGETVVLETRLVAVPEPEISWTFNNKTTVEGMTNNDVHMYNTVLRLEKVTTKKSGRYTVTAANREGEAQMDIVLTVLQMPKVEDIQVYVGDSFSLSQEFQWTFKANKVKNYVDNCTTQDGGVYKGVITKDGVTGTVNVNVTVKTPPTFVEKLEDQEVAETETALFTVIISEERAEVTWHKDGEELKADERIHFVKDEKLRQLVIKNISVHDEGEYTCCMADSECTAELSVVELSPELIGSLKDCQVSVGDRAMFSIELTKGDALVRWYKDEVEIQFSEHIQLAIDGKRQRLIVYDCDKVDEGVYACSVGDQITKGTLTVEEPTVRFVKKLSEETHVQTDVELMVELSQDIDVTWIFNGKEIKSKDRFKLVKKGKKRILRISSITIEDSGLEVSCRAANVQTNTKLVVDVLETKPKVGSAEPQKLKKAEERELTIPFEAVNGKVTVTKDSVPYKKVKVEKTEIKVVVRGEDSGHFDVKVANNCGEAATSFDVILSDKPSRAKQPEVLEVTDNSVTLFWKEPDFDGNSPLDYVIQTQKKDGSFEDVNDWKMTETTYKIFGVEKNSTQKYRIVARNEVGESEPSEPTEVKVAKEKVKPPKFINQLQDSFSEISKTFTFSLAVSSEAKITWLKDGKRIDGDIFENGITKLIFTTTEESDGVYTCKASNDMGQDETSAKLTIRQIPSLKGDLKNLSLEVGQEMEVSVKFSGYPNVKTEVTRETTIVEHSRTETTVTIKKTVEKQDSGTYTIKVWNEFGKDSKSFDLKVKVEEKPGKPEAVLVKKIEKEAVTIEWKRSESCEKYSIEKMDRQSAQWTKVADVGSEINSYCVQKLKEGHEYLFKVFAENALGKSEGAVSEPVLLLSSIHLAAPRPPFEISGMSSSSLTLKWEEAETTEQVTYLVEKREQGKKAWQKCGITETTSMEITNLKINISYVFRVFAVYEKGSSEAIVSEEIVVGRKITAPSAPQNVTATSVTSKSVTLNWLPPKSNGGTELTGYIIEKKSKDVWEKVTTLDTSVTQHCVSNLKDSEYLFRVSAENSIGVGQPNATPAVQLKKFATPPSPPTAPLEVRQLTNNTITIEWGIPESDGGAPIEKYTIAIKDLKKTMWMEVGQVGHDVQKLTIKELQDNHEYSIRIFARNEIGLSEPLESEEPVKILKIDAGEVEKEAEKTDDNLTEKETPSLSLTETTTSWMREANMDADIRFYSRSALLRRNEYFFRIWHYAKELFK